VTFVVRRHDEGGGLADKRELRRFGDDGEGLSTLDSAGVVLRNGEGSVLVLKRRRKRREGEGGRARTKERKGGGKGIGTNSRVADELLDSKGLSGDSTAWGGCVNDGRKRKLHEMGNQKKGNKDARLIDGANSRTLELLRIARIVVVFIVRVAALAGLLLSSFLLLELLETVEDVLVVLVRVVTENLGVGGDGLCRGKYVSAGGLDEERGWGRGRCDEGTERKHEKGRGDEGEERR
jgi:hypothetical protein